jgi:hypothetical protein
MLWSKALDYEQWNNCPHQRSICFGCEMYQELLIDLEMKLHFTYRAFSLVTSGQENRRYFHRYMKYGNSQESLQYHIFVALESFSFSFSRIVFRDKLCVDS